MNLHNIKNNRISAYERSFFNSIKLINYVKNNNITRFYDKNNQLTAIHNENTRELTLINWDMMWFFNKNEFSSYFNIEINTISYEFFL